MVAKPCDWWHHFVVVVVVVVAEFILRWPWKFFILIGSSILRMQLWRHNEGTYDVIKKKVALIPREEYLLCAKFQIFPWCGFRDRGPKFFFCFFPIWLPHHITYNIIIIIETFYISSRSNGENFVSIWQAVAEKENRKFCADKQTYKWTQM